ncbi:flagellar protein FlgJ [Methylomarinovum caldicuralii]|uniref:Peptidoglycan hydrolase FlgJ n=1 Tax=Methylomarinovum caldicuralii TaxID=438856 RepID=A0AAU9CSF3_9GAMM|nr:flagellar assembly peptidoglycan hydrolase FlgJ [Methylomarinovum caldicuralii]BCX82928.1 flagellar protein FlgJ [Methylomarinovum caldicuralii]
MQNPTALYTDFTQLAELRRQAKEDRHAALKEAAKQFEAMFLELMLKQMRQASPGDPIFDNDRTRFYREMHDHQLALHLSRQGSVGIADMIVRQLGGGESTRPPAAPQPGLSRQAVPAGVTKKAVTPAPAAAPTPEPAPSRFESPQQFIATLRPKARKVAAALGVDPDLLLAQAALETGWGKRIIHYPDGRSSHNLFNIKAGRSWQGDRVQVNTLEYLDGVAVKKRAAFRAYDDYEQSFADYADLLRQPRYRQALRHAGEPEKYLRALQESGYATDPNYADKILAIYRRQTLAANTTR